MAFHLLLRSTGYSVSWWDKADSNAHSLTLLRRAKDAHFAGVGSTTIYRDPLRNLVAVVAGTITRRKDELKFTPDSLVSPALGSEAYPLSESEIACVLRTGSSEGPSVTLGTETRGGGSLKVGLSNLLGRHVAVLGATGQGKSCFTAAILQQLLQMPDPHIVIFDINGEYGDALLPHASRPGQCLYTMIGEGGFKIPYYALGRHGLSRLLLPSEKTQRPALAFALENLRYMKWFPDIGAAGFPIVMIQSFLMIVVQVKHRKHGMQYKTFANILLSLLSPGHTWEHLDA